MSMNCHSATNYFNLWLEAEDYSVVKRNILPTAGNALTIVVEMAYGIIADRVGKRFLLVNVLMAIMMVSNIMLSIWNIPKPALMAAYYLSYAGTATTPVLIVSPPPHLPLTGEPGSERFLLTRFTGVG